MTGTVPFDGVRLERALRDQHGVIARGQAAECGVDDQDIRKRVRRREWVAVHPGVYVNHTGPLTWRQRAWAAVLDVRPAALSHTSAMLARKPVPHDDGPIHVAVARGRSVVAHSGMVVHHVVDLKRRVEWGLLPPRVRIEEALIDLAAGASTDLDALAHLTDAVGAHLTTAASLRAALKMRKRVRRRDFLTRILDDIATGACSVLEHRYLRDVEQAHGLPTPVRQAPTRAGRPGFRDVDYEKWGVVIELDGRAGHSGAAARDRDMERDLDAAAELDRVTLRIGYGQVIGRACTTARKIGAILNRRGWPGTVTTCAACT